MLEPLKKNFKGLVLISGPTKSGKSQLAEFLIKEQHSITYIATSKPRENDPDWNERIRIHRSRRPNSWKLIEHPLDICSVFELLSENESILLDSLGGIVEQHLMDKDEQWESFQSLFVNCVTQKKIAIIIVSEEIGWGVVPFTSSGHIFRERLSKLSLLLSCNSSRKWLAINGNAIDLDIIGSPIP